MTGKNPNYQWFFYITMALLVVWNIYTLRFWPVAWYDEIILASITDSFMNGDGFVLGVENGENILTYGPVYFLLTSLSCSIGGFTIFSFRLVNLLFSFLTIVLTYKIMDVFSVRKGIRMAITLLFLIDILYLGNAHSGRMEFVALFFALIPYYLYYTKKDTFIVISSSVLVATVAFMTTPRIIIILLPIVLFVFIRLIKTKKWMLLIPFFAIPAGMYLVWIFCSYGSLSNMLSYYTSSGKSDGPSLWENFVGGNFNIMKWHIPLLMAVLFTVVDQLRKKKYQDMLLLTLPVILFYLIVFDTGMYAALILPFFYLLLAIGLNSVLEYRKGLKYVYVALVGLCFIVNSGYFVLKSGTVVLFKETRDERLLNKWFQAQVPEGSRVIGSSSYYYACHANNCAFKRMCGNLSYNDLYTGFKPEYMIINSCEDVPKVFETQHKFKAEKIAHYNPRKESSNVIPQLRKFVFNITTTYEGDLYRIVY